MKFSELVDRAIEFLQRRERVTYRALKREFDLDDEALDDLKAELIDAQRIARDEDGKVLVWVGREPTAETEKRGNGEAAQGSRESDGQHREPDAHSPIPSPQPPAPSPQSPAERRQLTVMFCDLVGSTSLSGQLDPEELREVVRAYQQTSAEIIERYGGYIAQYLGDGLLVYFGSPTAHEDDAARAVRAGLEIVKTLQKQVPSPLVGEGQGEGDKEKSLQVRIGIHTGPVVVGEMGGGRRHEQLALGETPNIAARVQGVAEPNTVLLSAVTHRLVQGLFECQNLGPQTLKGIATPLSLYRVVGESTAQSRFDVAVGTGLTPLVGRESELGLLRQRWDQAKAGAGQAVLLSGEPGIGKSRLVRELQEQVSAEGATYIEFRCSPYHQNSAFYPIVDHLQRLLQFAREDSPTTKLEKLQHVLHRYRFPQTDTLLLLSALLSLPHPEGFPPITFSPQKQKEKTQAALVAWLVEEAEKAALCCAWEDLHWADPSTLEVLTLLLDQAPTTRLLAVLTFRPEFTPPWGNRSHLSQLTLSRLGRDQVESMVEQVAAGKPLPAEVVEQIRLKTDGVPLFVEELTKMVIESDIDVGARRAVPLPLGIPSTLQDALMARLDRLNTAKELAQLGATLGREFSYELLQAVAPVAEASLQQALVKLVDAEVLYQRGLPPQATYLFKHALIQDTAYQSLLKSKRQQLHQQIVQVLTDRFPEAIETQPELIAHHYTEAGLIAQAIPYWQKAGERANQRSANVEAIAHLSKGLELLKTLPDAPEHTQQELMLQITLGGPLMATQGYAAVEVEKVYSRVLELCRQVGETPQLFPVLKGLYLFYVVRGELQTTRELVGQLLRLAQSLQDPALLMDAYWSTGVTAAYFGEFAFARAPLEQGIALYDPQHHRSHAFLYGQAPRMFCLSYAAWTLWFLGYPDQALKKSHEALVLAREWSHPHSLAVVLNHVAWLHHHRREEHEAKTQAQAAITLSTEHGFAQRVAMGTMLRGRALAEQGQGEEGIAQIRQGLTAYQATGAELMRPYFLALLAEAYGKGGEAEQGLAALGDALAQVEKTGERWYEAELYRLKGELLLAQESKRQKVKGKNYQSLIPSLVH